MDLKELEERRGSLGPQDEWGPQDPQGPQETRGPRASATPASRVLLGSLGPPDSTDPQETLWSGPQGPLGLQDLKVSRGQRAFQAPTELRGSQGFLGPQGH